VDEPQLEKFVGSVGRRFFPTPSIAWPAIIILSASSGNENSSKRISDLVAGRSTLLLHGSDRAAEVDCAKTLTTLKILSR